MTQSIDDLVVTLIARHKGFDRERVTPGTDLEALGVSSLDAITLAYQLEEALGVEIANSDIESLRTVQDLVDGLHRLTAAKG